MRNAIILHGMPSKKEYLDPAGLSPTNRHWLPWIQHNLLIKGILTQTPELPEPYEPNYEKWKKVFEQFEISEDTTLIGHSCGAGFLVRWLSENKVKTGKVILVAPWTDPKSEEKSLVGDFYEFDIDPSLSTRTKGLVIFISHDDDQPMLDTVEQLKKVLPDIKVRQFETMGHFTFGDMGNNDFPELLEEVLR